MQASNGTTSKDWEEVDVKEVDNLNTESNGSQKNSQLPKKDVLSDHLDISIVEAEKRINGPLALKEYFTVYLIETRSKDGNWEEELSATGSVWRRYSEFELMKMHLENCYPEAVIPPLPEKKASYIRQNQSSDNIDPVFVERRRSGLESFLLRVAAHPVLCHDKTLLNFLQSDRSCAEVDAGKYVQQAETKLKSMSVSMRLKKPDEKMQDFSHYGSELESGLANLLRIRVRLADRIYAIHKLHANYGRVFSEWSALEKTMGDSLQKEGHYMDSYAAGIDSYLDEEDVVADSLKEYLHFGQSLQELCSRHQMAEFDVEKAEVHLNEQRVHKERSRFSQDGVLTKLWGKVTGTTETYADHQSKMQAMEQNVTAAVSQLESTSTNLSELSIKASEEIERFQQQKNADLQESLANYVMLQLKLSKMGLQTWKNMKEALQELP